MKNKHKESSLLKQDGMRLAEQGHIEKAKALFVSVCRNASNDAEAWLWLGRINGKLGDIAAAGDCFNRAILLQPDYCEAHVNLGKVYMFQGLHEEAMEQYHTALRIDPQHGAAYTSLGHALLTLGKYEAAMECYEMVTRLKPQSADAFYNLGNILSIQMKYSEAASHFEEAIHINPGFAAAYNNLGAVLYKQNKLELAINNYEQALMLDPDYAEAYTNLGIALLEHDRIEAAEEMFNKSLHLKPDLVEAYSRLGFLHIRQGNAKSALEMYQKAVTIDPRRADMHSSMLMTMYYLPEYSRDCLLNATRQWALQHVSGFTQLPNLLHSSDSRRRIRIGYVSGDFHTHPVSYFIEPILSNHDPSRYEIFCYHNDSTSDDHTHHLRTLSEHWRNISGQSDKAVIHQIRQDGIDILVDLSGHTGRNRLLVFAQKPAPIQATYMGYYATTGMQAMDYIIADRFVIPPDHEAHFVERVMRLPQSYLCFSPPPYPIDVSPLPALSAGKVTFGCFNKSAKLNYAVIETWSKLLHALPNSTLIIKCRAVDAQTTQDRYRSLFSQHGIGQERLQFSGFAHREEFISAYREVDIALDPFPYNGGTTTMESLWMGVPVVTLRGDSFVSRIGLSILSTLGMHEHVAETEDDYIATAVALASNLDALAELRAGLRRKLMNSPLCDGIGFTKGLEEAYRDMWGSWCRMQ